MTASFGVQTVRLWGADLSAELMVFLASEEGKHTFANVERFMLLMPLKMLEMMFASRSDVHFKKSAGISSCPLARLWHR